MRIVFCEDNRHELDELMGYVKEYFRELAGPVPEYAAYSCGDELLKNESFVDIAFLDVMIPGLNGIYIGNKLKENNRNIKIFIVTAYSEYLDEAMKFQVFRYLTKPLDKKRLFRNLGDAVYQYNLFSKKISICTSAGILVSESEEIVCIESNGRRTLVYTPKEIIECADSLQAWKERLVSIPYFYQSHRSFIVNFRYVYKAEKDNLTLKYGDKEKIAYLAKRKYTDFKDKFLLFLEATI